MNLESIRLADGAAYFTSHDVLVVADLHLGRTATAPGRAYPEPEYEAIQRRLQTLLDEFEPTTVLYNGDFYQHVIPPADAQTAGRTLYTTTVDAGVTDVVFTVGNHEEDVENLQSHVPSEATVVREYTLGETCFTHGHRTPTTPADAYVIAHIHPETVVGDRRIPCYLYQEQAVYEADVFVLPAFSTIVGGVDVLTASSFAGICPVLADSPVPVHDWQVAAKSREPTRAADAFEASLNG